MRVVSVSSGALPCSRLRHRRSLTMTAGARPTRCSVARCRKPRPTPGHAHHVEELVRERPRPRVQYRVPFAAGRAGPRPPTSAAMALKLRVGPSSPRSSAPDTLPSDARCRPPDTAGRSDRSPGRAAVRSSTPSTTLNTAVAGADAEAEGEDWRRRRRPRRSNSRRRQSGGRAESLRGRRRIFGHGLLRDVLHPSEAAPTPAPRVLGVTHCGCSSGLLVDVKTDLVVRARASVRSADREAGGATARSCVPSGLNRETSRMRLTARAAGASWRQLVVVIPATLPRQRVVPRACGCSR